MPVPTCLQCLCLCLQAYLPTMPIQLYVDTSSALCAHAQVCHALHPKYGGRPDAELGEVAAKLSRAKVS